MQQAQTLQLDVRLISAIVFLLEANSTEWDFEHGFLPMRWLFLWIYLVFGVPLWAFAWTLYFFLQTASDFVWLLFAVSTKRCLTSFVLPGICGACQADQQCLFCARRAGCTT